MSADVFSFDKLAVRRSFSVASQQYDSVAVLQAEVRQRLVERLALFKLQPQTILDSGCGTALSSQTLQVLYPRSQVIALDAAFGMLQHARPSRWQWFRKSYKRICADAYQLPFKSKSVDLIFSNLMLQWCDPPDAVFAEIQRVQTPGGVFIFSSFGPDTLQELRNAWMNVDAHTHVNRFIDMHDLGDAMMRAGLAEPVLDVERFTLTYPDALTLMRELKAIGAHNITQGRRHGLMGKAVLNQVIHNYEKHRRDNLLPASYEVVYGQAWGNATMPVSAGEVRIPIANIGKRGGQT